jgi:hypothetical protein
MQLSLARENARFFGTLTLKNRLNNDACLAVGVRNSVDKSYGELSVMQSRSGKVFPREAERLLLRA